MDMDLDAIYDDVRVDEENLSFVEEEVEEEMFLKFRNFWRVGFTRRGSIIETKYATLTPTFLNFFCWFT